ncbi:MAG: hypothetical protein R3E14_12670 [Erythrobacter sp.]
MWRVGGSIAGIRLAAIALRFGLTIYITAELGLVAMGQYGLILGLGALSPALFGFGLNFHMARALVGAEEHHRLQIMRSRIGFTLIVLVVASVVALPTAIAEVELPWLAILLIAAILWGEALGMDIYIALNALRFNVLANFSLALRTAFWIPLAIGISSFSEDYRTLNTILACWLLGQIANLIVVGIVVDRRMGAPRARAGGENWARSTLKDGLRIWPSDLALVLIAFGDRFILSATVNEIELGIFVFFWSFANVAQTLIQASIITPSLPRLIQLHRENTTAWIADIRRLASIVIGFGCLLGAGIYCFVWLVSVFVPQANFPWSPVFGAVLILATIVRFVGDFLSTALNSAGDANAYSVLNVGFALTLMAAMVPASIWCGILGAAIAMLVVAVLFNLLKLRAITAGYKGPE